MEKLGFNAQRIERTYRQTIHAAPEKVFPLLGPVREAEWLDGWRYRMLYSRSGMVEEGAVFSTPAEGEADTVWIVTQHNAQNHVVEFARFTPGSRTCTLKIAVTAKDQGHAHVDVAYAYTSITMAGNAFLDRFTAAAFLEAVKFWEDSMNYFRQTGNRLART